MPKFTCPRCGYNSDKKDSMQKHFNRKNLCKPIVNDIKLEKYKEKILNSSKMFICEICLNVYNRKDNLTRHLKIHSKDEYGREEGTQR